MIEYNFTELDNDFITCWCKYLLTGDSKLVMKDLERLAELGQINAIQEWYRFNKVGDNANIDKILHTLGDTYNELLIKARIGSKELAQTGKHGECCAYMDEKRYIPGIMTGHYELTKRAKKVREEFKDITYINDYYSAINKAFEIGTRTDDAIVLETANEIYSELAGKIGIDSYSNQMYKEIRKINSEICSNLLREIKKEKKENPSYEPLTDPRICFVLCKAILLFNSYHKQKPLAIQLLKELSNREYSEQFKKINSAKR